MKNQQKPAFSLHERVLTDDYRHCEGTICKIAERDAMWKDKYIYFVEIKTKSFLGKEVYKYEWILEYKLNKFIK